MILMEYPTGYLFAPSDYGNQTSGIDRKALKKSLQETRAAIKNIVSESNKTFEPEGGEVLSANTLAMLARQPNTDEYKYEKPTDQLDPNDFLNTVPYSAPEGVAEQNEKDQAFLDAFRLSLEQKAPTNKENKKDKTNKPEGVAEQNETEGLKLPGLVDPKGYSFDLYSEGSTAPTFEKNPTFDGKNFEYFLERAKKMVPGESEGESGRPDYSNMIPADKAKNALYTALKDAGLSEEEIFKGAQYAGLSNLRTESDSIRADVEAIKKAVDSNYYEDAGKSLKSEKNLFKEFKELGGKGNLQEFTDAQKYKSYDSEKDAQKFADYLSGQLMSQGIYQGQSGFDKAQDAFGKKFSMSEYNAALGYKNQDAKYIANYLKDYIKKGGKVGNQVLALLEPEYDLISPIEKDAQAQNVMGPLTPLQAQFQTTFPMREENMGPLQYSFG